MSRRIIDLTREGSSRLIRWATLWKIDGEVGRKISVQLNDRNCNLRNRVKKGDPHSSSVVGQNIEPFRMPEVLPRKIGKTMSAQSFIYQSLIDSHNFKHIFAHFSLRVSLLSNLLVRSSQFYDSRWSFRITMSSQIRDDDLPSRSIWISIGLFDQSIGYMSPNSVVLRVPV